MKISGIMDYSPYMTIPAALQFREDVGGEAAIMEYNHRLAVDGGIYIKNIFGTEILQDDDQIGSMIDIRLPIDNVNDPRLTSSFWVDTLLDRFPQIYAPVYKHGNQWWIRISAQIYNDFDDFELLGNVFSTICSEINGNNSTGSTLNTRTATALVAYGAYSIFSGSVV